VVAQHKWWKGCIVYACVKGMFSVWEGYGVGAFVFKKTSCQFVIMTRYTIVTWLRIPV